MFDARIALYLALTQPSKLRKYSFFCEKRVLTNAFILMSGYHNISANKATLSRAKNSHVFQCLPHEIQV